MSAKSGNYFCATRFKLEDAYTYDETIKSRSESNEKYYSLHLHLSDLWLLISA